MSKLMEEYGISVPASLLVFLCNLTAYIPITINLRGNSALLVWRKSRDLKTCGRGYGGSWKRDPGFLIVFLCDVYDISNGFCRVWLLLIWPGVLGQKSWGF